MALLVCTGCTAAYSVGAPRCPQCNGTEYVEEGAEDMAKITVHGGPSNEAADEPGGEDVSAGTSSSTPSEKEPNSPEPSEKQDPSPARTTGSRSAKGRTAKGSTARQTDGDPETGTSATGSADK